MRITFSICIPALLLLTCASEDNPEPSPLPSMLGNWKYVSYEVTQCDNPDSNMEEVCIEDATTCGVLTLTETTWTWSQELLDGSQHSETGTYTKSTNSIVVTGGSLPDPALSSIHGSVVSYTNTSLIFINSSISTGCTFTVSFVRYSKTFRPFG